MNASLNVFIILNDFGCDYLVIGFTTNTIFFNQYKDIESDKPSMNM